MNPEESSSESIFSQEQELPEIGRLSWREGKFCFEGNADEAAKIFFQAIQGEIDRYIASKGKV